MGGGIDAEVEIRRSRFLTKLRRVTTEDAARGVVEDCRRTYVDARHHCSAFILGPDGATARSSDDGEPSGTAGVPMLNVLHHHGMSDVVAVVSRYFGGIKLGAGGLVRAYSDAVAQAVSLVGTREVVLSDELSIDVPMADAGAVEAQLRHLLLPGDTPVSVDGIEWDTLARIHVTVPRSATAALETALASLSGGTLTARTVGRRYVDR